MSVFSKLFGAQKKTRGVENVAPVPVSTGGDAGAVPALTLSDEHVLLNAQVKTKQEVLELISKSMSSLGLVSGDYLGSLVAREEKINTYLTNGVAIPHGVNEAKGQVVKTGVVIVQVPDGVVWNDKGDVARLIVGIAAKGQEHLGLLSRLTRVVMDAAMADQLSRTTSKSDVLNALNENAQGVQGR